MGLIDKNFIVDNWVFTSCWELIQTTTALRSSCSTRDRFYGDDEESFHAAHSVLCCEDQQEIMKLQEAIENAESDPGVGEEYVESLEEQLSELRDQEPREVLQYWVVHKDLAEHHGWGEMGISPPVFEWLGLYIWICTYNSIRDDSFIEALCEYIHTRR